MKTTSEIKDQLVSLDNYVQIDAIFSEALEAVAEYVVERMHWENDHIIEVKLPHHVYKARFISDIKKRTGLDANINYDNVSFGIKNNLLVIHCIDTRNRPLTTCQEYIIFSDPNSFTNDATTMQELFEHNLPRIIIVADGSLLSTFTKIESDRKVREAGLPKDRKNLGKKETADHMDAWMKLINNSNSYDSFLSKEHIKKIFNLEDL